MSTMGSAQQHKPVLLILAAFSRYSAALDWCEEQSVRQWGDFALRSERFQFLETRYYEREMGTDLRKTFFAFERLVNPTELVNAKLLTNKWEQEYAAFENHLEARPLNLDPGYLTEAKLVLATTKDRDHRLYLDRGIFAEVTLYFHHGQWTARPWTYADYQRADFHEFFQKCRDYLRQRYRDGDFVS